MLVEAAAMSTTIMTPTTALPHFHQLYRQLAAQQASAAASGLHVAIDAASAAANITAAGGGGSRIASTTAGGGATSHMRLALTITHLLLVSLGSVNLLVIFIILVKPYMRSITNVYMLSLCLADFIYLTNLSLVAATQLNDKYWPFGDTMCVLYHGSETTGKYASVLFVVLLAVDRYCCMCQTNACARYRNFRVAIALSLAAWTAAVLAAFPLYYFADVALIRFTELKISKVCIAKWPDSDVARWYITVSSVLIFALPLVLIIFCYYHILNKMREALKRCKRMRRGARFRAPYHRVTRLVLWVVVFHVICWSPFWLFNLFSSIFRLRISTEFDRIVINIIHLFPYVNCALNPLLYATHAENFRVAFRALFCGKKSGELALQNGKSNGNSPRNSRPGERLNHNHNNSHTNSNGNLTMEISGDCRSVVGANGTPPAIGDDGDGPPGSDAWAQKSVYYRECERPLIHGANDEDGGENLAAAAAIASVNSIIMNATQNQNGVVGYHNPVVARGARHQASSEHRRDAKCQKPLTHFRSHVAGPLSMDGVCNDSPRARHG